MMKKIWGYIGGVFLLLLGILFYQKKKISGLEAQKENSDLKTKDAVLGNEQQHLQTQLNQDKEALQKQEADKPQSKDLSPEEVEKYWDKK